MTKATRAQTAASQASSSTTPHCPKQTQEVLAAAARPYDCGYPLAHLSTDFLAEASRGNLDLSVDGFSAAEVIEERAQASLDLCALAEVEQVRRHMSLQRGQEEAMASVLSTLASSYLNRHGLLPGTAVDGASGAPA